ncbi:MAG TPA: hypothetical protein VKA70_07380 [Blastocatellia bacterium]|nr:hypothetical protein [Blastocatellia bacterium]
MKRAIITALHILITAIIISTVSPPAEAQTENPPVCPIVLPQGAVRVAPNQPEVAEGSTVGIINALCEVTLNFVGCGFMPNEITISCDTNGDGVAEAVIPLKEITLVNGNLVQATLAPLAPQLSGTPFPLSCCGGVAKLTLARRVGAGDDNIFGDFTQSITCNIALGKRAPITLSATPSDGACAVPQNLIITGACFIQGDGKPNVTRVFAVERSNPANVIESPHFVILNNNLIDALFDFTSGNAGKTFLIFASGPNGTSRNLRIPAEAPEGCVLGNEQGVQVTFTCQGTPPPSGDTPAPIAEITTCRLKRSPSGSISLEIFGPSFVENSTVLINGVEPKKLKYKNPLGEGRFGRMVANGKVCENLPGAIIVTRPNGRPSIPFACTRQCQ